MPIKARANKCSLKRRGERVVCSANSSSVKNRIISEYKQMQHNPQMRENCRYAGVLTKQAGYCGRPVGCLLLNIVRYRWGNPCLLHL